MRDKSSISAIANKLGTLLSNAEVRRALCCPQKPLRFRRLMDQRQPLVINPSKGRLGSDTSEVVGGVILSAIAHAAHTRVDTRPSLRRPYFVYVDEFHNFTTQTVAEMLSELRKYKVSLTLAGQHTGQVNKSTLESILGNVGSQIIFRLGAQDAPLMARHLGDIEADDLINLPNYHFFSRLMVRGEVTKVFSGKTIPSL